LQTSASKAAAARCGSFQLQTLGLGHLQDVRHGFRGIVRALEYQQRALLDQRLRHLAPLVDLGGAHDQKTVGGWV